MSNQRLCSYPKLVVRSPLPYVLVAWVGACLWLALACSCARALENISAPNHPSAAAPPFIPAYSTLPPEAVRTLELIRRGGPFPYPRDGIIFHNREQLLPARPLGYYREYTVPTAREKNRGAQRLVCGGARREPEVCYYTSNHYRTFFRVQK